MKQQILEMRRPPPPNLPPIEEDEFMDDQSLGESRLIQDRNTALDNDSVLPEGN